MAGAAVLFVAGFTGCHGVGTQWAVRAAGWLRGELVAWLRGPMSGFTTPL